MTSQYLFKINVDQPELELLLDNEESITVKAIDYISCEYECGDDFIIFNNIWQDTNLEYRFLNDEIKENIYLKNSSAPKNFKFNLSGYNKVINKDGDFIFIGKDNTISYIIRRPFVIDNQENIIDDSQIINHTFNKKTGAYTVHIIGLKEEQYPIIIDPNFIFPNSHSAEGEVVGAVAKRHMFIIGSDSQKSIMPMSNKIEYEDGHTEILGSDAITFHRNVNVCLNLMEGGEDDKPNISSIKIIGEHKTKTLFNSNNIDVTVDFNNSITPILLYVNKNLHNEQTYSFTLKLDDSIKSAKSYSVTAGLVLSSDAPYLDDISYGSISEPEAKNNGLEYLITYKRPQNTPAAAGGVLLRVDTSIVYEIDDRDVTILKPAYAYIQYANYIIKDHFIFKENASKNDFMNADCYLPTQNRGLVVIDTSLGIIRTIDQNNGLPQDGLDVYCALRIGTPEDPRGLLVCTKSGLFYYCDKPFGNPVGETPEERCDFRLDPFKEPAIYEKPIKIWSKQIIDAIMSGPHLFLLDVNGEIYHFATKLFLNNIVTTIYLNLTFDPYDLTPVLDQLFDGYYGFEIRPFHPNSFQYKNSVSEDFQKYQSIYRPDPLNPPTKLHPIFVRADHPTLQGNIPLESVYFEGEIKKLYGMTVLYKQKEDVVDAAISGPVKIALSVVYPPWSISSATNNNALYDGFIQDRYDLFDETLIGSVNNKKPAGSESRIERIMFASVVDALPDEEYEIKKISRDDKPTIIFDLDITKDATSQYNYPILYIPQIEYAASRVVVGSLIGTKNLNMDTLFNNQPQNNQFHFNPKNLSILAVEEFGQYYDLGTGKEIQ